MASTPSKLPPSPPPPPPLNPWAERPFHKGKPIMDDSNRWPYRLLNVESMTSHIKQGECTYNGVEAPVYNVISYTWGFYQDATAQSLPIYGVDWPIPSIRSEHFTPETFARAIRTAAKGVKSPCEWVWLDVACIPQAHEEESLESLEFRFQEIGRQAKIFGNACEAFVWMSSLRTCDMPTHQGKLTDALDIIQLINEGLAYSRYSSPDDYLQGLRELVINFCGWMNRLLDHPWFKSLWTLQESTMRHDAFILFDDGLFLAGPGTVPWSLMYVKHTAEDLRSLLVRRYYGFLISIDDRINQVKAMVSSPVPNATQDISDRLVGHLTRLHQRLIICGFEAVNAEFPNAVYSLAQHRRSTWLEDRIYGIIQTYDISCNQMPSIEDEMVRLHALEDEFGEKLVKKLPVLSQLFVHTMEQGRPRRSWLITQNCYAADIFWVGFTPKSQVENLFHTFEVLQKKGAPYHSRDLLLRFEGKAWNLDPFIEGLRNSTSVVSRLQFLESSRDISGRVSQYRGLILDHHVSRQLFGQPLDYLANLEMLLEACEKLSEIYCQSPTNNGTVNEERHIKVALLGSNWDGMVRLPLVNYVGIVLAPCIVNSSEGETPGIPGERDANSVFWERVGLVRWTEVYRNEDPVFHEGLPPWHEFTCLIR
jgi:hypothetical protein